jgi:hypothetical protein
MVRQLLPIQFVQVLTDVWYRNTYRCVCVLIVFFEGHRTSYRAEPLPGLLRCAPKGRPRLSPRIRDATDSELNVGQAFTLVPPPLTLHVFLHVFLKRWFSGHFRQWQVLFNNHAS